MPISIHQLLLIYVVIQSNLSLCPSKAAKLARYVTEHQAGENYSSYSFLTSALDGVSDQRHTPATP
jgi:hypothetical protein